MASHRPNLNETAEVVEWPECHYVFVEATGPFQETAPHCWKTFMEKKQDLSLEPNTCQLFFSMYKVRPEMVYRAGASTATAPSSELPEGLNHELFPGGKYAKFVLTGPYDQLPEACGRVRDLVKELNLSVREDAFNLENYANDPKTTPPEELLTEILVPIN